MIAAQTVRSQSHDIVSVLRMPPSITRAEATGNAWNFLLPSGTLHSSWCSNHMNTGIHKPLILIVEDDALQRMWVMDVLTEAGFQVREAAEPTEALQELEAHPQIRAVLTDAEMAGDFDGVQLVERIRALWPHVGVVLISGRLRPGTQQLPPGTRYIAKPARPQEIVETVEAAAVVGAPGEARAPLEEDEEPVAS
jgi:two-component system, response regulator PdtaR